MCLWRDAGPYQHNRRTHCIRRKGSEIKGLVPFSGIFCSTFLPLVFIPSTSTFANFQQPRCCHNLPIPLNMTNSQQPRCLQHCLSGPLNPVKFQQPGGGRHHLSEGIGITSSRTAPSLRRRQQQSSRKPKQPFKLLISWR